MSVIAGVKPSENKPKEEKPEQKAEKTTKNRKKAE